MYFLIPMKPNTAQPHPHPHPHTYATAVCAHIIECNKQQNSHSSLQERIRASFRMTQSQVCNSFFAVAGSLFFHVCIVYRVLWCIAHIGFYVINRTMCSIQSNPMRFCALAFRFVATIFHQLNLLHCVFRFSRPSQNCFFFALQFEAAALAHTNNLLMLCWRWLFTFISHLHRARICTYVDIQ